jgi:ribose 5-phosphate isomerase A
MSNEAFKRSAAEEAIMLVKSGMVLGLGTGTTVKYFLDCLGERLANSQVKEIRAVASSLKTESIARRLKIPLCELDASLKIDLTIDGADEIDPKLDLIKGAGGALLREKIVAEASHRYVIIADETKLTSRLGAKRPVPVEVVTFAWRRHEAYLRSLGQSAALRTLPTGEPFITDSGNYIPCVPIRPWTHDARI